MRKIAIVVLALTFGLFTFLFIGMPAFGHPYPEGLPKNFKNAPEKTICRQKVPPHIFREEYRNPTGGWAVIIEGRGSKPRPLTTGHYAPQQSNAGDSPAPRAQGIPKERGKEVFVMTFPIQGREGKTGAAVPKAWWLTSRGWKMYDEMWSSELAEMNKFSRLFDEKVWGFLDGCEVKNKKRG